MRYIPGILPLGLPVLKGFQPFRKSAAELDTPALSARNDLCEIGCDGILDCNEKPTNTEFEAGDTTK